MVTHIVIFSWGIEATVEQVGAFRNALDQMADEVGHLTSLHHGSDLRFREGNGDYALIARFPDQSAWRAYQAHPKHKAFLRDFVEPLQARRIAIQF